MSNSVSLGTGGCLDDVFPCPAPVEASARRAPGGPRMVLGVLSCMAVACAWCLVSVPLCCLAFRTDSALESLAGVARIIRCGLLVLWHGAAGNGEMASRWSGMMIGG